jgi:hypothetical protein
MRNKALSDLKFYILPSADPPVEYVPLHDKVFEFWMGSLREAFRATNNDESGLHDEFLRQDWITCLCAGEEVVATLLLSRFTLDADAASSFRYLTENYTELYFRKLKKEGVRFLISMQYLTVHPDWRKRKQSISIAPALPALARFVQAERNSDALIGVARRDVKVNEQIYSLGGKCVVANVDSHNTPCDLIAIYAKDPAQYPSPELRELVEHLWRHRVDATAPAAGARVLPLKKAA